MTESYMPLQISSDGTASFKDVYVSGVQNGSAFGSIRYRDGITSGSFNGNSSFESTLNAPLRGTCINQIESIASGQITTDLVRTKALEAGFLAAETIKADFMETADWTYAGCIRPDRIASCSIGADKLNLNDNPASWIPLTVVTGVTPIKDENGTVIDIAVSTKDIWFPGKKED